MSNAPSFLCVHCHVLTKHTHTHTYAAVDQISPRERRIFTTPRSVARPSKPALLPVQPSRLWARHLLLFSAGPHVDPLQDRSSRSLLLTGPGLTPALCQVQAGPVHSASRHPAASGRSTRSISTRWVRRG